MLLAYKSGALVRESDQAALFWGGYTKVAGIPQKNFEDQLLERIDAWSNEMPGGLLWIEHVRTPCPTPTTL